MHQYGPTQCATNSAAYPVVGKNIQELTQYNSFPNKTNWSTEGQPMWNQYAISDLIKYRLIGKESLQEEILSIIQEKSEHQHHTWPPWNSMLPASSQATNQDIFAWTWNIFTWTTWWIEKHISWNRYKWYHRSLWENTISSKKRTMDTHFQG